MSQSFGRYELLELLGRGGMGEVYRARDTERRRDVALKLLPEHLAADPKFMARFRRESHLAARLSDPHTIPIHDFGEIDGRLFIDMRLVAGSDLGSVLEERERLPAVVAVDVLNQVASALDAAHAEGLVHRDVKPSNIMLTGLSPDLVARPPFAYLVDFGIARSTLALTAVTDTSSAAIGTVAYMSPERIGGELGDGRGDVYALACVLFEALTGQPPFAGELVSVIYQHMNADPPRVAALQPGLPAGLDAVIARGMAKDPDARYDSAGDLAVAARLALSPVRSDGPVTVPRSAPRPGPVPGTRVAPAATADERAATPDERAATPDERAATADERAATPDVPWMPDPPAPRPRPRAAGPSTPGGAARTAAVPTPLPPPVTLVGVHVDRGSGRRHTTARLTEELSGEQRAALREIWTARGGAESDVVDETLIAAFPDADAAIDAAAAAQRELGPGRDGGAGLRIGVHTGRARRRDGRYWGPELRYAAGLAAAAGRGQVLVSDAARAVASTQAFQPLGAHPLGSFPTARPVHHLVIDGSADVAPPRPPEPPNTAPPNTASPITASPITASLLPSTPLLGRGVEVEDVVRRLGGNRQLVTLAGEAGSGRTRLALEAGRRLAPRFESVWFVALEAMEGADEVVRAVARAIGLPELAGTDPLERLVGNLRGRRVLLILDGLIADGLGADGLIPGGVGPDDPEPDAGRAAGGVVSVVERLVAGGEGVHVLVTSRRSLALAVEHLVPVVPLTVPDGFPDSPADLASAPAVRLFVHAARAAGGTALDPTEVASLCRRLDGLPLAIELVAARTVTRQPATADVADRDPELRGLTAALRWSVGSLDQEPRRTLIRTAGFAAGFSLEIAEAAFGDVLDDLAQLVEARLLRETLDGRFAMPRPVRLFAAALATADGEPDAVRTVAIALLAAAERYEAVWMLTAGEGRLRLGPEIENILNVLRWTAGHDAELHARLSVSTAWLLAACGLAQTSRAHVEVALAATGDLRVQARGRQALGLLGADPGDSLAAAELWRQLGDTHAVAVGLARAAEVLVAQGEPGEALALLDQAEQDLAGTTDPDAPTWLLGLVRAEAWGRTGRDEEAAALADRLAGEAEPGSWREVRALGVAAGIARHAGRPADALTLYGRAMTALVPFGVVVGELGLAEAVAVALLDLGRADDAIAALAVCEAVQADLSWPPGPLLERHRDRIRDGVGPERVAAARHRAMSYSPAEALARARRLALSVPTAPPAGADRP